MIALALEAICTELRWDCGAPWSASEDGLVRRAPSGMREDKGPALTQFASDSRSRQYRPDEGSLGRALGIGGVVRIDTQASPAHFARDAMAHEAGLITGLVVPIVAPPGEHGAGAFQLQALHCRGRDAGVALRVIALQIAQYRQRKLAERSLRFMASHDELTGMLNRSALQSELDRAIKRSNRSQKQFAAMFVDLDRFKHINDTLGHSMGDEMIKGCGRRLMALLRNTDVDALRR